MVQYQRLRQIAIFLFERLLTLFVSIKKNRITIVSRGYNGSNSVALYKLLPIIVSKNIDVMLVFPGKCRGKKARIRLLKRIASSSILITTHGAYKYKRQQYCIELWHGFPLKGMSLMDRSLPYKQKRRVPIIWKYADMIASYSSFYNTAMNSCIGIDNNKYKITGMPRNDLLLTSNGRENLSKLIGQPIKEKRIILFLPTYRQGYMGKIDGAKTSSNIFGFEIFDWKRFSGFLKNNDCHFFFKLHPNEELSLLDSLGTYSGAPISFLSSNCFDDHGIDLYEVLGAADLLVTDYSSVYFDFLLLDRPIIFIPVDLEAYRSNRGFLLEPFSFWTPGPKVHNQTSLEKEIERCLLDPKYYKAERELITPIIHFYQDSSSSKRIWKLIEQILRSLN